MRRLCICGLLLLLLQGVPRTQLQLVGVACMLIAAKHEEVRWQPNLSLCLVISCQFSSFIFFFRSYQEMHPSILDFATIADNCFMVTVLACSACSPPHSNG